MTIEELVNELSSLGYESRQVDEMKVYNNGSTMLSISNETVTFSLDDVNNEIVSQTISSDDSTSIHKAFCFFIDPFNAVENLTIKNRMLSEYLFKHRDELKENGYSFHSFVNLNMIFKNNKNVRFYRIDYFTGIVKLID